MRPASANAANILAKRAKSDHDIDDPLRDDNDLFRTLASKRSFYLIERQNGSLYLGIGGVALYRYFGPFFAIDLDRQRDSVFHQQIGLDLGPVFGGHKGLVSECRPAFFGQMRHHWVEKPDQDVASLAQGPAEIGRRRFFDVADGVTQRVGKFIDMSHASVETEFVDIVGYMSEGAMRSFAYGKGLLTKCRRPCRRSLDVGDLPDKPPQPLNEAPRTLNAFLGPDHVAVGRRIRTA